MISPMPTSDSFQRFIEAMKGLSPEEFVDLIGDYLRALPEYHSVVQGPILGPDGGIDISAKIKDSFGEESTVVFQCKRYTAMAPSASDVGSFVVGMSREKASAGVIASTTPMGISARNAARDLSPSHKIYWKDWCGLDLVRKMAEKVPGLLKSRFPELSKLLPVQHELAEIIPSFELVAPNMEHDDDNCELFYSGWQPTWANLSSSRDIIRSIYSGPGGILQTAIDGIKLLGDQAPRPVGIMLSGVAGSGKSVILHRLAYDLAQMGRTVIRLRSGAYWNATHSLSMQIENLLGHIDGPLSIMMDDISDFGGAEFGALAAFVRDVAPLNVFLMLGDQSDRWWITRRNLSLLKPTSSLKEFCVTHLNNIECESLVDRILQYETEGLIAKRCGLNREQRMQYASGVAERQMLVAMLQMRFGNKFEDIIIREQKRIPSEKGQELYIWVSYLQVLAIHPPRRVLVSAMEIARADEVHDLELSTTGILISKNNSVYTRHLAIARVISGNCVVSPNKKIEILSALLRYLYFSDPEEVLWYQQYVKMLPKKLIAELGSNWELIKNFYADSGSFVKKNGGLEYKYLLIAEGRTSKRLQKIVSARQAFTKALDVDPTFSFVWRQLAWLEHDEGNWSEAANFAKEAVEKSPHSYVSQLHCGIILTFGLISTFFQAEAYLRNAILLDPDPHEADEMLSRYLEAKKILSVYRVSGEDAFLPNFVIDVLKPGWTFLRNVYGVNSKQAKRRLNQGGGIMTSRQGSPGDEKEDDSLMRGILLSNSARTKFERWYKGESEEDLDEIEGLFKESLELGPHDPFTHCWHGTFLKEARGDFDGAAAAYDTAVSLSRDGNDNTSLDHPMFLNNIALLIVARVQAGLAPREELQRAKLLAEEALSKQGAYESGFHWPSETISICDRLIQEGEAKDAI